MKILKNKEYWFELQENIPLLETDKMSKSVIRDANRDLVQEFTHASNINFYKYFIGLILVVRRNLFESQNN